MTITEQEMRATKNYVESPSGDDPDVVETAPEGVEGEEEGVGAEPHEEHGDEGARPH